MRGHTRLCEQVQSSAFAVVHDDMQNLTRCDTAISHRIEMSSAESTRISD